MTFCYYGAVILTQIADNIGSKDNGCGICSLLSPLLQQEVLKIQLKLQRELSDNIWCMPLKSLHITLCEILQNKPYTLDKNLLFEQNKDKYVLAISEALKNQHPIEILFNRIEASTQAIIIRGDDDKVLDNIRHKLVESLPLPVSTKLPPTIVHSSIARFTKEVDLDKVESVVQSLKFSFTETIQEFQLVHNVWPHMLNYDVFKRFTLSEK